MRPLLHPALSRVWRDATTLQIGVTPAHAVVVGGLGTVEKTLLRALNGSNDLPTLRQLAAVSGGPEEVVDRLVETLDAAGVVVDQDLIDADPAPPDPYLDPDRASLGLIDRGRDGGQDKFARRARQRVEIAGAGRVGASVARLLAAGGVVDIEVDDPALVTAADVSPAGHGTGSVGLSRDRSLRSLLEPSIREPVTALPSPDFLVLTQPVDGEHARLADTLVRAGIPHLVTGVTETVGVVGPLVVPGISACLRCLELHRTDRDRSWPAVLDQAARNPPRTPACDASLATAVAGLATGQVLAYLDGFEVSAIDGTIEIELPYGLPRRRSWRPHPHCGCGQHGRTVPGPADSRHRHETPVEGTMGI